jgi:nucleoside-diphosphate-sugar epimerase
MNNRVLVVGGAGYIGGFLTSHLMNNGYSVTVYDNLLFEDRYLKACNFVYGDIRDKNKLLPLLDEHSTVVWLAAIVGDGACEVDHSLTKEINVDCFKWMVDNFDGKIIFPSTCSVYGINENLISEDAQPNPLSLYAATKLEAETYVLEESNDALVFRLGTLFGLSDRHSRLRLDLVSNILSTRAASGEQLSVFGGSQWRPLLHVRDVATAVLHGLDNDISGLFNLSAENYTISNLAREIKKVVPECDIKYVDMKFEDLRNYKVKNDKFAATGWAPKHSLGEGIKQIVSVIRQNRIKNKDDNVYSNVAYLRSLNE